MADMDTLAALLGQLGGTGDGGGAENSPENGDDEGGGLFGDIDLETIMKLMDAFSQVSGNADKNTRLLLALKPHLKNENRSRVDKAIRLMKLMSVFTALRESGAIEALGL